MRMMTQTQYCHDGVSGLLAASGRHRPTGVRVRKSRSWAASRQVPTKDEDETPVGDLEEDTAVERVGHGHYRAIISADWALWRPVGGYIAAIALRAAGAHSAMPLPASLSCQYLSPVRFDVVDIEVDCLSMSRHAKSLTVRVSQHGSPVLSALVWTIADDIAGPERRLCVPPDVPPPEQVSEMVPARAATPTGSFWQNLEVRNIPIDQARPEGLQVHNWTKFRPRAFFDDPWVDACRELILIDTAIFPAAAVALGGGRCVAVSMDLYVAFHSPPPAEDYLLVTAQGTAASAGLVCGIAQTRSLDGTLTASGGSQLMFRMLSAEHRRLAETIPAHSKVIYRKTAKFRDLRAIPVASEPGFDSWGSRLVG
jgi:acyl-CoA thioesterase